MKFYYKGYRTELEYSEEDACFFGKIDNSSDLIMFSGPTESCAQSAFIEAVDSYIEFRKEIAGNS